MYNGWPNRETWAAANWFNQNRHAGIGTFSRRLASPKMPGWQKRTRRRLAAHLRFLARQAGDGFTRLAEDRSAVDWPMIADGWLRPLTGYVSPYGSIECPPGLVVAIDRDPEIGCVFSHFVPATARLPDRSATAP